MLSLVAASACMVAGSYWLGRRHRARRAFLPREISGWRVRSAGPADAAHIHRMVKELAEFEKMGDGALLTVRDFRADLAAGAFECLLLEVQMAAPMCCLLSSIFLPSPVC